MKRYEATKVGMTHGWRVRDILTGETVRSGYTVRAVAEEVAEAMSRDWDRRQQQYEDTRQQVPEETEEA